MEIFKSIIVPILIAAIPALIGFFSVVAQLKANNRQQKKQQEDLYNDVIKEIKQRNEEEDEVLRCLLRTDILNMYFKHIERDQKYLIQYESENLHKMFDAYVNLGGNSFIQDIYDTMVSWEVRKN